MSGHTLVQRSAAEFLGVMNAYVAPELIITSAAAAIANA